MSIRTISNSLRKRLGVRKGQGIVEYAIILALVVLLAAVMSGSSGIKEKVTQTFTNVGSALDSSNEGGEGGGGGG